MSWDEIERRRRGAREQAAADDGMATACWLVFGAGNGKEFLEKLHALFVARRTGPETSERALSFFDGQRQLVLQIEAWTEKGKRQDAQERAKRTDGG